MKIMLATALMGGFMLTAPLAFADEARDNLIRTQAEINALNPADATQAGAENYRLAQMRLREAETAEDRNRDKESVWRSAEASLHAQIVAEEIKLHALERTVSEIELGIATLRREITS